MFRRSFAFCLLHFAFRLSFSSSLLMFSGGAGDAHRSRRRFSPGAATPPYPASSSAFRSNGDRGCYRDSSQFSVRLLIRHPSGDFT